MTAAYDPHRDWRKDDRAASFTCERDSGSAAGNVPTCDQRATVEVYLLSFDPVISAKYCVRHARLAEYLALPSPTSRVELH